MHSSKHFKTYLKIRRLFSSLHAFRKSMGASKYILDREIILLNRIFESLTFTKKDQIVADSLTLNLSEKEKAEGKTYPKFIYEKDENKFFYFIQGYTESVYLNVKIESKKIPMWKKLERLLLNTPLYYFLFDISFYVSKNNERGIVIMGLAIDSFIDLLRISTQEKHNSDVMYARAEKVFLESSDIAEKTVDTFLKEAKLMKDMMA